MGLSLFAECDVRVRVLDVALTLLSTHSKKVALFLFSYLQLDKSYDLCNGIAPGAARCSRTQAVCVQAP